MRSKGKKLLIRARLVEFPGSRPEIGDILAKTLCGENGGDENFPKNTTGMPRYRFISREEVRLHCADDDCWIVVGEDVFDLTPFTVQSQAGREFARVRGGTELAVDELPPSLQNYRVISKYMLGKLETARISAFSGSPENSEVSSGSCGRLAQSQSLVGSGPQPRWHQIIDEKDREISQLQDALAASERRFRALQSEVGELMGNLDEVTENLGSLGITGH